VAHLLLVIVFLFRCIALGCSGIVDPTTGEICYDNKCNTFFECIGECPVFGVDDNACCGCKSPGADCGSPSNCGNGVCDFGESLSNCFVDCSFNDCPNGGEIKCFDTCVDIVNNVDNCGSCGVKCPTGAACVLRTCSVGVGVTWMTTVAGGGEWIINNEGKTIRFAIEDSANCGGSNSITQSGTATAEIVTAETYALTLEIVGIAELQNDNYELMIVSLNGQAVVSATSTELFQGCAMGPAIFTELVPPPYILPPGVHTFEISFTTNDGLYHVDAFYELNLVFVPYGP
jgi:hypothetical protein